MNATSSAIETYTDTAVDSGEIAPAHGELSLLAGTQRLHYGHPAPASEPLLSDAKWRSAYRAADIVCSAIILLALLPLALAVAIAIRMESPGPALFTQIRVGRNGRLFQLFKFRSMVVDAERLQPFLERQNERSGPVFKMQRDPRITQVGQVIRKFSIDEVPQLINVLRGDMSMVGPRPALPSEVIRYTKAEQARLAVDPGLTGLAQISGRADLAFEDCVSLDLAYIQNRSPYLNLKIIAKTIPAVLSGRGAY